MYVIIEHEINDPKSFFDKADDIMANKPSSLKIHQFLPSEEGTRAVCLWECSRLNALKNFIEGEVGAYSENTYYAIQADKAIGLPAAV
jgi:hypothetical protein